MVTGQFVDLGRTLRTVEGLQQQTGFALSKGVLKNVPRILEHEHSLLRQVVADLRAQPEAWTGAPDVVRGTELLAAVDRSYVAMREAALAGIEVERAARGIPAPKPLHDVRIGDVLTDDGTVLRERLGATAGTLREARAQLGGTRPLPEYESGPARDLSKVDSDPDWPLLHDRRHERFQRLARTVMKAGPAVALGLRTMNESTLATAGGAILAPFHITVWDGAQAAFLAGNRFGRPMASTHGQSTHWLQGPIVRAMGSFPIEHKNAEPGLRIARALIADGQVVVAYPHGKLIHGNFPAAHGRGVADLAVDTGAPVSLLATWGAGPRFLSGQEGHRRITGMFGGPFTPPESPTDFNRAIFRERIAREMEALTDQARAADEARGQVRGLRARLRDAVGSGGGT